MFRIGNFKFVLKRHIGLSVVAPFLLFSLVSGSDSFAQADVSPRSQRELEKARSELAESDITTARFHLRKAIHEDANNIVARVLLAEIYLGENDGEGAEKELKAAEARGYDPNGIAVSLASAYLLQRKYQDILDDLTIDRYSNNVRNELSIFRAQAAFHLNDFEAAEAELKSLEAIGVETPQALIVYSWILRAKGESKAAEQKIDEALLRIPDDPMALVQKGELLREKSEFEAAREYYSRAIAKQPFDIVGRIGRAFVSIALEDFETARNDADILLEQIPGYPSASYVKAYVLMQENKLTEALSVMTVARKPELFPNALFMLATLHFRNSQLEQARANVNKFLSIVPDDPEGLVLSGSIFLQMKENPEAIKVLEKAYQANSENLQVVALLADAYNRAGQHAKASDLYDEATTLDPDNEELRFRAVEARMRSGVTDEIIAELSELAFGEVASEAAATRLMLAHMQIGDFEKANQAINRVEEITGPSASIGNHRASVALAQSKYEEAEELLRSAIELDPEFEPAQLSLARLFVFRGELTEARQQFESILKRQEGYQAALFGLANLAKTEGKTNEVLEIMARATRANPQSVSAHMRRVGELIEAGQNERALFAAREFQQQLPEEPEAFAALGQAHLVNEQFNNAIVTYRQLVNRIPQNPKAYELLARSLIAADDKEGARVALDRALFLLPDYDDARRQRVFLEKELRGQEEAEALAEKLFAHIEDPVERLMGVGSLLMGLGNETAGLDYFRDAYENTGSRGGLLALFNALTDTGENDKAEELARNWLKDNPEDSAVRFILYSRLIEIAKLDEAIVEGEILQEQLPEDPIVLNNLAWLYNKKGRVEEAAVLGRQAYNLAPGAGDVIDTVGWILKQKGETGEAVTLLTKASRLKPENFDIQYHYAAVLADAGSKNEAVGVLREILKSGESFMEREEARKLLNQLQTR